MTTKSLSQKNRLFLKENKTEISNICFNSIVRKKRYTSEQVFKRKIVEIYEKKIRQKLLQWENERKLFTFHSKKEKPQSVLCPKPRNHYPMWR